MLIGFTGAAGSGKDTAARLLAEHLGSANVQAFSFAEPMKTFCMVAFGFTEQQLWGSLEDKATPDSRFTTDDAWYEAMMQIKGELGANLCIAAVQACHGVCVLDAHIELVRWFSDLRMGRYGDVHQGLTPRLTLQTIGTEWGRHKVHEDLWGNLALRKALGWLKTSCPPDRTILAAFTDARFINEMKAIRREGGVLVRLERKSDKDLGGAAGHASEAEQESPEALKLMDFFIDNRGTLKDFSDLLKGILRQYNKLVESRKEESDA